MVGIGTGVPSVRNYTLLKGEMLASFIDPDTNLPTSWRSLGNICEATLSLTSSREKHYQCLSKVRTADLTYITELDATITLRLDELDFANFAIFAVGEARKRTLIAAGTGIVNATGFLVANPDVAAVGPLEDTRVGGRWYDLGVLAAGPLSSIGGLHPGLTHDRRTYGVTATNVEIIVGATTYTGVPVGTAVTGNTFTVNEDTGMIFIPVGSALEIAILADSVGEITDVLTYSLEIGAYAIQQQDEVSGLTGNQVALALKLVGINGANLVEDELLELTIFQAVFYPDGDFPLFSESELGRFTIAGDLQRNQVADPGGNGYFTLRKL